MNRSYFFLVILIAEIFLLVVFVGKRSYTPLKPDIQIDTVRITTVIDSPPPEPKIIREVRTQIIYIDSARLLSQEMPDGIEPIIDSTGTLAGLEVQKTDKVYETEDYRAVVSGIGPSLDSIVIYRQIEIVTNTQSVYIHPSRWSIGIQAGYGYGKNGAQPYAGIGIQYDLWRPKGKRGR